MASAKSGMVAANGMPIHFLEQGTGPVVLLCHGFPESSYSWRHQLRALAAAGYRAIAPDMRGYGKSGRPKEIAAYANVEHVRDMTGLLDALGEKSAAIVGHDWGANVAWNAALMRPDRFKAVAALSVPFSPRAPAAPMAYLKKTFAERFFYILYFQEPGVVEAELGADIPKSLRSIYYTISAEGDGPRRAMPPTASNAKMLDTQIDPGAPPAWLSKHDFDFYVREFARNGFEAPLNWYRNIDRNWELLGPYADRKIEMPALFIGGDKDPIVQLSRSAFDKLPQTVPGLAGSTLIPDCGHWTQQEKPNEVNALLIDFLKKHYG